MLYRVFSTFNGIDRGIGKFLAHYWQQNEKRKNFTTDSEFIAAEGQTFLLLTGDAVQCQGIQDILATLRADLADENHLLKLFVVDEVHR